MARRKESEIAFLAGLFDSRGCIKIEKPRNNETSSLYCWITDKSFKLMEFLQTFGARIGKRADGQYRAKWKDRSASVMLSMIFPFLIVKKEQADVGIEFYKAKEQNLDPKYNAIPLRLRLMLLKRDVADE